MMNFGLLCLLATTIYVVIVEIFDLDTVGLPDTIAVTIGCCGALIMIYCMLTSQPSAFIL